jgi:uncharacterized membrane protein YraQ (UPF0718 family)
MKTWWMKISGGVKLFILVILLYTVFAFLNIQLVYASFATFWNLLKTVFPILLLVFFLMFISSLLLSTKQIIKMLGHESGIKGYFVAIIFGILSGGPIYMWYPLLADLQEKGAKNSLLIIFLYNRAVKIPLIPMMIFYFGFKFVVILSILMVITSVINGIIVDKILLTKKI